MPLETLLIFSIIIFFASFIHATIGFGLLLVATPILALFTDMKTAIIYLLIPTVIINLLSIYKGETKFFLALKKYFPLAMLTTIGTGIGTQILIEFQSDIYKFF